MRSFRSAAGLFFGVLWQINLEISFDQKGSISSITCSRVKEKAAYLVLKVISRPLESERTQLICWRHSFEQYLLPGFILSVPQERHLIVLVRFEYLTTLLLVVCSLEFPMENIQSQKV